jgi:PA14 domain
MRRYLLVVAIVALVLLLPGPFIAVPLAGQTPSSDTAQNENSKSDSTVPLLRVTTSEVLVDLIALDRHNQPVLDLKPDELQVAEGAERATKKKRRHAPHDSIAQSSVDPITSLSVFDPNDPASSQRDMRNGFRILASCLERSEIHYLLAFYPGPSGWTSGYHSIAITTSRRDTKLFYRHHYYVGLAAPAQDSAPLKRTEIDQLLQRSACYYPVSPLSIALRARLIDTGRTDVVRYLVSVDASSLSFLMLDSDSKGRSSAGLDRRVAVDYGTCNFDEKGKPTSYFHAPVDQALTSTDYARALDRGFPHILEFPASEHIALTRVVLRDRATGNMGAADVILPQPGHAPPLKASVGSFGSIVPAPHSFCGDVYELPVPSEKLPDFRELDPIGALYTSTLDVRNQNFSYTSGIPGVTPRTDLFGIDYHASFWVRTPGEYKFWMASDDGAILQIDDKEIINLDGLHEVNQASGHINLEPGLHTMHVPYYQGAPISVALELEVKPPGASHWALFNLGDYQAPTATPDVNK